ncbi:MAG: TonB-dependent receptor plug domain-containing protein, partial [Bacteroidales bacterium]|nr:TonB-dependent receptor plug domain-containing protein [Bacteroidales bacterium]
MKGTQTGVVTDANGKFSIHAASTDVLQISSVGYTTQDIEVGNQTSFEVNLSEGEQLEEVVVTGMGITREAKSVGYAVTTIQSKELTKVGSPNFAAALYGKAPGVRIQQTQGGSIAGVSINVRGFSSLTGNVQPLVILNGVPVRNGGTGDSGKGENKFSQFGDEGRIRANGLVDINPEDIESLTILKGAAATALYGSEAANGVVMITSKQSRTKGISVDVNALWAVNQVAYVPQIQTEYGPGVYKSDWSPDQVAAGGFMTRDYNGQSYLSSSYSTRQWGPKFDGRPLLYWDGSIRNYEPISKDPWHELLRTGYNQTYNVAINQGNDWASTRFSYTF